MNDQERNRIAEAIESIVLQSKRMDIGTAAALGTLARLIAQGQLSAAHKLRAMMTEAP